MTPGNVNANIDILTKGANSCVLFSESQADLLKLDIKEQASLISERCDYRMGEVTALLTSYVSYVYLNTNHRIDQVVFHHSPSLIGIITTIVSIGVWIYNAVKTVIVVLHLGLIWRIHKIVYALWPEYRAKVDEIMGKISEMSGIVGQGVDGLIHLLHTAQSGINIYSAFMGKDILWLEGERALAIERIGKGLKDYALMLASNPSKALNDLFYDASNTTYTKFADWWDKTELWLNETAEKAEQALINISETTSYLLEFQNSMPQFVRDHIPQSILDGLTWVTEKVDNDILPLITNLSDELEEAAAEITRQRAKAAELAARLALPGNILLGVDQLTDTEKSQQEVVIDDVTSRVFEREADEVTRNDSALIEALASIKQLSLLDIPDTEFSGLEDYGRPGILWDEAEKVDGWFVGDF